MAGEDYQINGENISKIAKRRKVDLGLKRWNTLYFKYDIKIIKEDNNLILFSIGDKEYYYGIPSQKIRRRCEREWSSKIVAELKKDFEKIPLKESIDKVVKPVKLYSPTDMAPGKYKDKTWLEVSNEDPNYIKWMISVTKDKRLKIMLEGL